MIQCSLGDEAHAPFKSVNFENIQEIKIADAVMTSIDENDENCAFIISPWLECVMPVKSFPSCERFKKVAFSTRNCGPEAKRFEENFLMNHDGTLWLSPFYSKIQEKFPRCSIKTLLQRADDGTVIFALNFAGKPLRDYKVGELYRVKFGLRIHKRIGEDQVSIVARLID